MRNRITGPKTILWATCLLLMLAGLTGPACSPEIKPGQFSCSPHEVDPCPAGYACLVYGADHRCFANWRQTCGNGILEAGEQCDGSDFGDATCADHFPEDFTAGEDRDPVCQPDCTVSCRVCGDGRIDQNQGEQCDDGENNSDDPNASCRTTCQARSCGDGILDDALGEECDGQAGLIGVSCVSLGYYQGTVGTCQDDCRFDRTPCQGFCGNGVAEEGEECDGADLRGLDCLDLGESGGRPGCDTWCRRSESGCRGLGFREVYRGPGSAVRTIWVADDGTLFAGRGGSEPMLIYDGTSFAEGSQAALALSGRSATDVWAVPTYNGGLWHYDGAGWSQERTGSFIDVWALDTGEVIALTMDEVHYYDGSSWSILFQQTMMFNAGWASAANDVHAGGLSFMWHYDGQDWNETGSAFLMVMAVWGSGQNDAFLVDSGPTGNVVYAYDGQSWSETLVTTTTTGPVDIWGSGPQDVYVTLRDTAVRHYDGIGWSEIELGDPPGQTILTAVGGTSADNVWIGGANASETETVLYRLESASLWETLPTSVSANLTSVWGTREDDVWVAGEAGTMLHFDGQAWAADGPGTTADLVDLGGALPDALYTASATGFWRREGDTWVPKPTPSQPIRRFWVRGASDVYAVGTNAVFHFDGQGWTEDLGFRPANPDLTYLTYAIWGTAEGHLFVGAQEREYNGGWIILRGPRLLRFDGQSWTVACSQDVGDAEGPYAEIWGTGPDDVMIVSQRDISARLLRFNGTSCEMETQHDGFQPQAIWGARATEVFLGGHGGTVAFFDGTGWTRQQTDAAATIRRLWGLPGGPVFAVGDAGLVLRQEVPLPLPSAGPCEAVVALHCGSTARGSTNLQPASLADYSACAPGLSAPGPEVLYRLQVPITGSVQLSLTAHTGDLDLFVLDAGTGGTCEPAACLGYSATPQTAGQEVVQLDNVVIGDTLYVAVDGPAGSTSGYQLSVLCQPQ